MANLEYPGQIIPPFRMTKERIVSMESYVPKTAPFTDDFGVRAEDPVGKRLEVFSSLLCETISLLQDGYLNRGLCRVLWDARAQLETDYKRIRGGCFVPGGIECVHRMRLNLNEVCFLLCQVRSKGDEIVAARRDTVISVARQLTSDLSAASRGVVPLCRVAPGGVAIAS